MNIGAKVFLTGLVILSVVRALVAMADGNDNTVAAFFAVGMFSGLITACVGAIMWIWLS